MSHRSLYALHPIHQEVKHLQAEITRLQGLNQAAEQKALETEALKCELATVTSNAERERRSAKEATCTQFSSLIQENNKLAARASSLANNFQEAERIIKVLTLLLYLGSSKLANLVYIDRHTNQIKREMN